MKQYGAKRNTVDCTTTVQFFDENGLTAFMQEGQWFFPEVPHKGAGSGYVRAFRLWYFHAV